jgi:2-polyprenyl-6-hydroxyphenyl methylase/3-demethylubiquinone-9 3-methyltransferase
MLRPTYSADWPDLWKTALRYDEQELWGSRENLGYSYNYQQRRDPVLKAVERLARKGGAVLDVAAGNGNFSLPVAEKGFRVTWNDIRPELATWVQQKYERGEIEYIAGNLFEFVDTWKGRYDAVIATEIIEHVAHPDEFLVALAKVTAPGGIIVITTPNGKYFLNRLPKFSEFQDPSVFESKQFGPDSGDHIFLLHPEELEDLGKKAGLKVEQFELYSNPLTAGHVKLGHLLPVLPKSVVWALEKWSHKLPAALGDKIFTGSMIVYRKP